MARYLIIGCGYIGRALADSLLLSGGEVWVLRRTRQDIPRGAHFIQADVLDETTLEELPPAIDYVVYSVAANSFDDSAYQAAYVVGLKNSLRAVRRTSPEMKRFLFISSTGVYAQEAGELVDESSEVNPKSFSGKRLLEGEAALLNYKLPGVVLRLSGIYGPGREGLLQQVEKGEASLYPEHPVFTNRIHRDDCVEAIKHLLALPQVEGIYLGTDDEPTKRDEVLIFLIEELNLAPPREERGGTVSPLRGNKRCSNERLKASGFILKFPTYREGYRDILARRKASGK